jgi:hypothetical protein
MKTQKVRTHAQNTHNCPIESGREDSAYCVHCLGGIENLFHELRSAGVEFSIDRSGRLAFDGPDHVLTDSRLATMRSHRDDLIAVVERFEERAAIAQYDGGLIRSEAERQTLSELPTKEQVVAPDHCGVSILGVFCPFCRWNTFEELAHGDWRCRRCEKIAWSWLGRSFVRVDVIDVDLSA